MHSLLKRQLAKTFGEDFSPPENLKLFIDAIERTYKQTDQDRAISQRAMQIASEELTERQHALEVRLNDLITLTEKLAAAKEQAESTAKLKDQFISLLAHDLKSPFNSMLGFMKLILSDRENALAPKHQKFMEKATKTGEELVSMIETILNIARLNTGKIVPQKKFFDAYLFADSVIDAFQFIAGEKGIEVKNEIITGTRIHADPNLYREVMQNILSNALKFCARGDSIIFSLPKNRPGAVSIRDTGPGIAPQIAENIFKHEVRTSTQGSSGETGTGLGLPYAMDIMKAHGGKIEIVSQSGNGAEFHLVLPVSKPSIIFADDEEFIHMIMRKLLTGMDIELRHAKTGREAVNMYAEREADMVITDLMMPEMDGFTLLEELRKLKSSRDLPVIVITADDKLESRDRAYFLGANDLVNKPFREEELLPRIKRFFL